MPAITQRPLASVSMTSVGIAAAPSAWLPSSIIPVPDSRGGLCVRLPVLFIGLKQRVDP
jgi:hypothetical protein